MCQALQELDIKARAAASIVDDWQGPIVQGDEVTAASNRVRSVWRLDQVVELLIHAIDSSRTVPETCASISKNGPLDEGESGKIVATLGAFLESLKRLERATHAALAIVEMFKSQGAAIARSEDLNQASSRLAEIIAEVEQLSEETGWAELNKQALPSAEFKELAAYLLETAT